MYSNASVTKNSNEGQANGLSNPSSPDSALWMGDSDDELPKKGALKVAKPDGRPGSADSGLSAKSGTQSISPTISNAALICKLACTSEELTVGAVVPGRKGNKSLPNTISYWRTPYSCGTCYNFSANHLCVECKDHFCFQCAASHAEQFLVFQHQVHRLHIEMPFIAGGPYSSACVSTIIDGKCVTLKTPREIPRCDIHSEERMRFMCTKCNKLICQDCFISDHRNHETPSIEAFVYMSPDYFDGKSKQADACKLEIRRMIDRVMVTTHHLERESNDLVHRLQKDSIPNLVKIFEYTVTLGIGSSNVADDAKIVICDIVERFRYQKSLFMHEQMAQLRNVLAGLAEITEGVRKFPQLAPGMDYIELIKTAIETCRRIKYFRLFASKITPIPDEVSTFLNILANKRESSVDAALRHIIKVDPIGMQQRPAVHAASMNNVNTNNRGSGRRPIRSMHNNSVTSHEHSGKQHVPKPFLGGYGMCIPQSQRKIELQRRMTPSQSFGPDGAHDGQLSRPWGVCIARNGNIIVSDRRNNRIQVFSPIGKVLYQFGQKGTLDGELELPAGITTDRRDRIVVADKDNHRVQIFSADGQFILKFGGFGKLPGEFQYPWDVATNTSGNIIVSDTRNHRVQLFNEHGEYIAKYAFETNYFEKVTKGHITPRGVCFNPSGDILVTDFENHRIMKLDSGLNRMITQVFSFIPYFFLFGSYF